MLSSYVLVLNKSWIPISVTSSRNAIVLIYQNSAHAVCHETYNTFNFECWTSLEVNGHECLQTVEGPIPLPEIVVLTRYNGIPHRELAFTKKNLFKRDNYTCQYCLASPKGEDLTIDHVIPKSRGGKTHWENCVVACRRCNRIKANRLLKETHLKLKKKPVRPRWDLRLIVSKNKFKQSWEHFIGRRKK